MKVFGLTLDGLEIELDVPNYLPEEVRLAQHSHQSIESYMETSGAGRIEYAQDYLHLRRFKKHIYTQIIVVYQELP